MLPPAGDQLIMATLIFGQIGRFIGGPIGGILGTVAGGFVDRLVLGSGPARDGPRLGNLAVQSAAYGEPIPHVHGRLRLAGNLIWTAGIREARTQSGGGKRGGPVTNSYSYSSSFAVALCGRPIIAIGRVWADGKPIRDASGAWLSPISMRLHAGSEDQPPDPLIAAAEPAGTPAYRGIAYAVFEDLPLADYGNRIPNLTFEVIADSGAIDAGKVAASMAASAGVDLGIVGTFPALTGHVALRAGTLAASLETVAGISAARVGSLGGLVLQGDEAAALQLPDGDADAALPGGRAAPERRRRAAAGGIPDVVEIGYFDIDRDYQAGLQRVRRGSGGATDHSDLPIAFDAAAAKALARARLTRAALRRHRQSLRLPWRHAGIAAGDRVALPDASVWRVREQRFENFIQTLDLEACAVPPPLRPAADAGRAFDGGDSAPGPTSLLAFELPPLAGPLPAQPQVWVAAAGASPGWRRAAIEISGDGGASFAVAGTIEGGAAIGTARTWLPPGPCDRWDLHATVEVELLGDAMWLEARTPDAVLAGANLALIGDELVQFAEVTQLGTRRFRLGDLLRGRRGSEAAIARHAAGERFVAIEPDRLLRIDAPVEWLGAAITVRGAGAGDVAPVAALLRVEGRALAPLSPVQLRAVRVGTDFHFAWVRRSRAGFGWTDFVDAPLAEDAEAYRIEIGGPGGVLRRADTAAPSFAYTAAMRAADAVAGAITVRVAQLGAQAGPGAPATLVIDLGDL